MTDREFRSDASQRPPFGANRRCRHRDRAGASPFGRVLRASGAGGPDTEQVLDESRRRRAPPVTSVTPGSRT